MRWHIPSLGLTDEDVVLLRGENVTSQPKGLIGLIRYSYHQVATSFLEANIVRTFSKKIITHGEG